MPLQQLGAFREVLMTGDRFTTCAINAHSTEVCWLLQHGHIAVDTYGDIFVTGYIDS